jgi:actin-related protein
MIYFDVVLVVPIYEGNVQMHAIVTADIGGVDVTHELFKTCKSRLPDLHGKANFQIVEKLKQLHRFEDAISFFCFLFFFFCESDQGW